MHLHYIKIMQQTPDRLILYPAVHVDRTHVKYRYRYRYSPNLIKVSNYFSLFIFSTIAADVATLGAVNGNGCLGCWKLTGIPEDPF